MENFLISISVGILIFSGVIAYGTLMSFLASTEKLNDTGLSVLASNGYLHKLNFPFTGALYSPIFVGLCMIGVVQYYSYKHNLNLLFASNLIGFLGYVSCALLIYIKYFS